MPHAPKPEIVASLDVQTTELMGLAVNAYRWLYGTAHSVPNVTQTNERVRGGAGHSDPTAGAALDPWTSKCRNDMVIAYREMKNAHKAALAAYRALARALDAEPEHEYAPVANDYTTKADWQEIRKAQKHRAARGDGWGES